MYLGEPASEAVATMEGILETITQSELVQLGSERGIFFEAASTDVLGSISEYFDATNNRCSGSRAKTPPPASDR